MLKIDPDSKTLVPIFSRTLAEAKVLERSHLQAAILRSWSAFCNEIGYEELFLVGSEIQPHASCSDRIDILALERDGTPVVFELKRHRHRLQLLQALSYAAMVARWDVERFRGELRGKGDDDTEELRSLLSAEGFALNEPSVVLIAESFDPEVILTADWLADFGVRISAFVVSAVDHRGDTLLSIDQRFPLAGVDDVYVGRSHRSRSSETSTSWDEALQEVSFPFAKRAVDIFRRHSEGNPQRRTFFSIYAGSPLGRMQIVLRRNYLKIYTPDRMPKAEKALLAGLGEIIPITPWGSENTKNSGFTFTIETEAQFERFLQAVGETNR